MIISLIIAVLVALIIFFVSGSGASFVLALLTLILGTLFSGTIQRQYRRNGLKLFYILYSVYTIFALFYYLYQQDSLYVNTKDEYHFFVFSQAYQHVSVSQIFTDCLVNRIHIENEGYLFYIGSLSSLATSLLDGNHLLLQFLGTTLIGSMNAILIYRLLLKYVDQKRAYKYGLLFLLGSVFFSYSFVLLRDIFIAFFYLWGFVIISEKFSIKGLIGLIILSILISQIRYENGLFFIIFILYYLYLKFTKYKIVFAILAVVLAIVSSSFISKSLDATSETLSRYSEFSEESALSQGDSFGKAIWKLPSPIKEVGIFFNSQLQPFPSWYALLNSENIFQAIVSLLPIFYGFFWFSVIFSLIKWLLFEKKFKNLSNELLLLSIIVIVFLLANTANMNIRRIMCVYPIIYLLYVVLADSFISLKNKKNTSTYYLVVYLFLIIIYLFMKYV